MHVRLAQQQESLWSWERYLQKAYVDIQKIVRDTVREIGYTRGKYGFDADTCGVITTIDEQSSDIAMGVDKALEAKENNMTDEEIDAIGAEIRE